MQHQGFFSSMEFFLLLLYILFFGGWSFFTIWSSSFSLQERGKMNWRVGWNLGGEKAMLQNFSIAQTYKKKEKKNGGE